MDVTIDLLIEVDKLIQLLESPIFICKFVYKKRLISIDIFKYF